MPDKSSHSLTDQAVAEGGAYSIIRQRLETQGQQLNEQVDQLNTARLAEFGASELAVVGRLRVRTKNNCIARDIVPVGKYLVFAYNVFMGMKQSTQVEDVFCVYALVKQGQQYEMQAVDVRKSFLNEPHFKRDFNELYTYYKGARFIQLMVKNNQLLAAFQIGNKISDIRVFRWQINPQGKVTYIDNRGERDIALPRRYDFDWIETNREHQVNGRHPHMNILDSIFVETVGGDLTIKIENNTQSGLGIYAEQVQDKNQSLDDARIFYAELGQLILLKILPYREETWRYLVFNRTTSEVQRIDAIGQSCVQLPENHGIIFPGGLYLQNGAFKHFTNNIQDLRFKRAIHSPNGEDIVYIFYRPLEGEVALYAYNLIKKKLQNPLFGHGYAILDDGKMVIFNAEGEAATRTHPMQVWQTPFSSEEYAHQQPQGQNFYANIGNNELVRGISDLYSVRRAIENQQVSTQQYTRLIQDSQALFDRYYWFNETPLKAIHALLHDIVQTAELVLDEFEKVEAIRQRAQRAIQHAQAQQKELIENITPEHWQQVENFVDALNQIRQQRGHLMTIKEYRYIDHADIQSLDSALVTAETRLGDETIQFLASEKALQPYAERLHALEQQLKQLKTRTQLEAPLQGFNKMAADLDVLSELMTRLHVDDATVRTAIIEAISQLYSKLNQSKARAKHQYNDLGAAESMAQFAAQFNLFSQGINNALSLSNTPDKTDEQLSRLLIQLEELESQFSEYDEFLNDIISKRDEIYETFEAHKQTLVDARQAKAHNLLQAAKRLLHSIQRRGEKFKEVEDLNTFYVSDALILKVRRMAETLRELDDSVKADDIEARLKANKDQAFRGLRDKAEIYEADGHVIRLGQHRFSVNTQVLDLTLLAQDERLHIHLTGTDFFEVLDMPELEDLKDYWNQALVSETPELYRAEYLAGQILAAAESQQAAFDLAQLQAVLHDQEKLLQLIKAFIAPRYKEGYEKGIHDYDAAKLLSQIIPLREAAELLRFNPLQRGLAKVFWEATKSQHPQNTWIERAQSAVQMKQVFSRNDAQGLLQAEIAQHLNDFLAVHALIKKASSSVIYAAEYLAEELAHAQLSFVSSRYAQNLVDELRRSLDIAQAWQNFNKALKQLKGDYCQQWALVNTWLSAMLKARNDTQHAAKLMHYIPESIAHFIANDAVLRPNKTPLEFEVSDLMGEHPRIQQHSLHLSLDRFFSQYQQHQQVVIPEFNHYHQLRRKIIKQQRNRLRLEEFKARPLTSFVRNRLINEQYLPMIGDNLAKQMGTVGENKRSDLMGLLMMISPPGYGKTTLMEYVAHRLGLIFMKINCPSLGHSVVSLDPSQAPDSASRQELKKLNMGLEMANNVMLYLDDIQHTNAEFLQKFISLSDGTRRIEGVWQGQARTYDMRGKKFCIVMAGNPYTESGEAFKIPDMLANRADIYNLGDILGGAEEAFSLSYLENSLSSNPILAPLAVRDMADVYQLIDMAKGKSLERHQLKHDYSSAERNEIIEVFKKLLVIQKLVLNVNQHYIASAAQADEYRTEPAFKLQGSYRNMNKMAEKVSAIMNEAELMQMTRDHYLGEAQLLTQGAEENLLKLAELRGNMSATEKQRWQAIKQNFAQ